MRFLALLLVPLLLTACGTTRQNDLRVTYRLGLLDEHCVGKTPKQQIAALNALAPQPPANWPEHARKQAAAPSDVSDSVVGFGSIYGQQMMAFKTNKDGSTACAVMLMGDDPQGPIRPWLMSKYSPRDYDGHTFTNIQTGDVLYAFAPKSGSYSTVDGYGVVKPKNRKGGYIEYSLLPRKKYEDFANKVPDKKK